MNKCDLLVAVGARFDDRVTGKLSAFAPGATVIHLDIDSAEIGKLRQADIPVVGPLKQVLADLADELRALHGPGRRARDRAMAAPARRLARGVPAPLRRERRHAQAAARARDAARPHRRRDDVVWTTGVGQHQMWAMQYLALRPAALVHHLGRPRDDGLRRPGRDRRQGGAPGRDRRLRRRRRLLPDDRARSSRPRCSRACRSSS